MLAYAPGKSLKYNLEQSQKQRFITHIVLPYEMLTLPSLKMNENVVQLLLGQRGSGGG